MALSQTAKSSAIGPSEEPPWAAHHGAQRPVDMIYSEYDALGRVTKSARRFAGSEVVAPRSGRGDVHNQCAAIRRQLLYGITGNDGYDWPIPAQYRNGVQRRMRIYGVDLSSEED
ncbi:MAG: hypothetical protein IT165_19870 [Bryobacterales bacterium]|nr:hypothetical protein [Bryobacterales bacterium]